MSSEWPYLRIGEIGKVTTGKTPSTSKPENFDGVFPFITIPTAKSGFNINFPLYYFQKESQEIN
jgi:restriction endonuclease S subunit